MEARKKLQVFISSTYIDLLEERQAAVEAILKAGHIPAGMELFTASNKSQWEIIKRWIDESDIYMLILGGRYGSIELESGKSYTHLEYEYAQSIGKPLFAVVIEESVLGSRRADDIEKINPDKLLDFRRIVLSYMSSFFKESKDIKLAVHESMGQITQDYDLVGWIRGNNQSDNFASEMVKLNDELRLLREENKRLTAQKVQRNPSLVIDINGSQNLIFSLTADDSRHYSPKEPIKNIPQHLQSYIEEDSIEKYNRALQQITEYDIQNYNYIQTKISLLLKKEIRKDILIRIANVGNIKANKVYVTLEFPNSVHVSSIKGMDVDVIKQLEKQALNIIPTQKYDPLYLAEKEYEKDLERKNFGGLGLLKPDNYIAPHILNRNFVTHNALFDSDSVTDNKITIKLSELMHGLDSIYKDYYIIPIKKGNENIKVQLLCEEYLETELYEIPITVN